MQLITKALLFYGRVYGRGMLAAWTVVSLVPLFALIGPTAPLFSKDSQKSTKIDPQVVAELNKLFTHDILRLIWSPSSQNSSPFLLQTTSRRATPKYYPASTWDDLNNQDASKYTYKRGIALADDLLPKINSHSNTKIEAFSGNRVALKIDLEQNQDDVQFAWITDNTAICKTSRCLVETDDFNVGEREVFADVFNRYGGFRVKFNIEIAFRKSTSSTQELTPPMVTPAPESLVPYIYYDQDYILAQSGRGYANVGKDIHILDHQAIPLGWNESLRTNSGAVLRFGRKGFHEHFVFGNSNATLVHKNSTFAIKLQEGSLRSRTMSMDGRIWKFLVKGGVEMDGDHESDLIVQVRVQKESQLVKAICLRGRCRITVPKNFISKKALEDASVERTIMASKGIVDIEDSTLRFHLQGGESLAFKSNDSGFPYLTIPKGAAVQSVLAQSTPEYLHIESWPSVIPTSRQLVFAAPLKERPFFMGEFNPLSPSITFEGKQSARLLKLYLKSGNQLGMLELLSQFPSVYFDHPSFKITLGVTYLSMHAYAEALAQLSDIDVDNPLVDIANYYKGLAYLTMKDCPKALLALDSVEARTEAQLQLVNYYQGVCHFYLQSGFDVSLQRSLWYEIDPVFIQSAQEFIVQKSTRDTFTANGSIGLFSDSNPLKTGRDDPNLVFLDKPTERTLGINSRFAIWGKLPTEDLLATRYGIDYSYDGYMDSVYQSAGSKMRTTLFFDHELSLPNRKDPHSILQFKPFFERRTRGGESHLNGFGLDMGIRLAKIPFEPGVYYHNSQYLDPDPDALNVLDPATDEPAPSNNRSGRFSQYSLHVIPFSNSNNSRKLDVTIRSNDHHKQAEIAAPASFKGSMMQLRYQHRLTSRWHMDLETSFESKDYPKSEGEVQIVIDNTNILTEDSRILLKKRADKTTIFVSTIGFLLNPNYGINWSLAYTNNQSTRTQNTYSRILSGLSYHHEL